MFYLGADEASLTPEVQTRTNGYRRAEVRRDDRPAEAVRSAEYLPGPADARVAYDVWHPTPWGWKVASNLWTKSIGGGALGHGGPLFASGVMSDRLLGTGSAAIGMVFLALTALLLIWYLKRPERFRYLPGQNESAELARLEGYILLLVGGLGFF